MNRTEILVVSQDVKMQETVIGLINNNENWLGIAASTAEDAIEKFHRFNIDLLLLIGDVGEAEVRKLSKIFRFQKEDLIILQADAVTGAELLYNEIKGSLEKQKASKKPSWTIMDDALKGAALDIHME